MIRRIITVLFLTGAGQLFLIFSLKYISQQNVTRQLSTIAETDTLIQLIISIIAFGLQSAAIRNLSLSEDWEEEYAKTQTARFTLGLVMTLLCLLSFHELKNIVFVTAPILALSGEYALYARGHAIMGAFVAFVRVFIPFLLLLIIIQYAPDMLSYTYFAGVVATYILTNLFISSFLKTKLLFIPRLGSLKLYLKSLPLGIVTLSFYFLGLGLLLIANYFFENKIIAIAFMSLKFYVIFKGIVRVIHQAFIKDMIRPDVCLKIDQLSSLAGLLFLGSVLIFPETFIITFFGKQLVEEKLFFSTLALAAFSYSLFSSTYTSALLKKKDITLAKTMAIAVSISLLCLLILSFFTKNINCISISLFLGEVILTVCMAKLFLSLEQVWLRLRFLLKNMSLLIIPFILHFLFEDNFETYLSSFLILSVLLLVFNYKNFKNLYEHPILITSESDKFLRK